MKFFFDLYFSGKANDDIQIFSIILVYYSISTTLLLRWILKRKHQQVSRSRFISGVSLFYILTLVLFDLVINLLSAIGSIMPSPEAGMLLVFIIMFPAVIMLFILIQIFVFRTSEKSEVTIWFTAAQPIVALLFIILLGIGSYFRWI